MTIAKPQTLSVIDSLSAGYQALNRRLWIVLIPIAVNLYLAFGVPVSLAPLFGQLREFLAANQQIAAEATGAPVGPSFQFGESLDQTDMRQPLLILNFIPLLRAYVLTDGFPTAVMPQIDPSGANTLVVDTAAQLLGLIAALNLATLVVSALFLPQVAAAVRDDGTRSGITGTLFQSWQVGWRIVAWALLIIGAMIAVIIPFAILSTILLFVAPQAVSFVTILLSIAVFWVQIYIGFAIEAIALDRIGPIRALLASVQVVRRNLLATLGLLLLVWFIGVGLGLVWQQLSANTFGVLFACAASAYVGTGLAAARMVFYRERLRRTAQLAR